MGVVRGLYQTHSNINTYHLSTKRLFSLWFLAHFYFPSLPWSVSHRPFLFPLTFGEGLGVGFLLDWGFGCLWSSSVHTHGSAYPFFHWRAHHWIIISHRHVFQYVSFFACVFSSARLFPSPHLWGGVRVGVSVGVGFCIFSFLFLLSSN